MNKKALATVYSDGTVEYLDSESGEDKSSDTYLVMIKKGEEGQEDPQSLLEFSCKGKNREDLAMMWVNLTIQMQDMEVIDAADIVKYAQEYCNLDQLIVHMCTDLSKGMNNGEQTS